MASIHTQIGPTFGDEVLASSVAGLPFSWGPTSIDWADGALTAPQITALQSLVDAHDHTKSAPATVSFMEFMDLFTPTEQAAIANSTDVNVKLWTMRAMGTGDIDLGNPLTKGGLDYLVTLGTINAGREASILSNTPPA